MTDFDDLPLFAQAKPQPICARAQTVPLPLTAAEKEQRRILKAIQDHAKRPANRKIPRFAGYPFDPLHDPELQGGFT